MQHFEHTACAYQKTHDKTFAVCYRSGHTENNVFTVCPSIQHTANKIPPRPNTPSGQAQQTLSLTLPPHTPSTPAAPLSVPPLCPRCHQSLLSDATAGPTAAQIRCGDGGSECLRRADGPLPACSSRVVAATPRRHPRAPRLLLRSGAGAAARSAFTDLRRAAGPLPSPSRPPPGMALSRPALSRRGLGVASPTSGTRPTPSWRPPGPLLFLLRRAAPSLSFPGSGARPLPLLPRTRRAAPPSPSPDPARGPGPSFPGGWPHHHR